MDKKEKIAFVTIRYSITVGGGAETLTRIYAETLAKKYDVDVITTKANNHVTWANEISEDEEEINGVKVKRFPVDFERVMDDNFHELERYLDINKADLKKGEEFMKAQGPYSSKMWDYLKKHKDDYKYVLYCPYLYATTYFGTQITNKKSNVLIPAAHDEPYLYFNVMKKVFDNCSKIIFLTEEEQSLVNSAYPGSYEEKVIGMGINSVEPDPNFRSKFKIKNPYIVYVGRIEEGKYVNELIEHFIKFKNKNKKLKLDLVLVGKSIMPIPKRKDIIHLGYLEEDEKIAAMQQSKLLVMSSRLESFSIVTLEAMKIETPVLVNGKCEVLKGHCIKSNGGLWYTSYGEFEAALKYFLENEEERVEMGKNGKKYVELNYTDDVINKKLFEFLN